MVVPVVFYDIPLLLAHVLKDTNPLNAFLLLVLNIYVCLTVYVSDEAVMDAGHPLGG